MLDLTLTSIRSGTEQSLLFACEEGKLHIAVEFDTFSTDGASNRKDTCRSRAIVISSRCTGVTERAATVVMAADEDGCGSVMNSVVAAKQRSVSE
jgi:hypothetical protein